MRHASTGLARVTVSGNVVVALPRAIGAAKRTG